MIEIGRKILENAKDLDFHEAVFLAFPNAKREERFGVTACGEKLLVRRFKMRKQTTQMTIYYFKPPKVPSKPQNYIGYPDGNIFKPEDLPLPNCELQHISLVNGYRYCGHKTNRMGSYCIFCEGNSGAGFECPLGLPRIYPQRYS